VKAIGDNAENIKIQGVTVQSMPDDRWRVSFQIAPAERADRSRTSARRTPLLPQTRRQFPHRNMGLPDHSLSHPERPLSEEELGEWEEAYAAVEAYLQALRLRNRLLVAELVRGILWRASARRADEPEKPARLLAMEEALSGDRRVDAGRARCAAGKPPPRRARPPRAAAGRHAGQVAGRFPHSRAVAAEPFVEAMRKSYLAAGPRFAELTMVPKPLEFNAFGSGAAQWWETMDRRPIVRFMFILILLSLGALVAWFISPRLMDRSRSIASRLA
jgi:hypothetical protein